MTRTLYFKTLMMDSIPIAAGQTTYSLFTPSLENNPSITDLTEGEILHWLLNKNFFRNDFIGEFFPDPHHVRPYLGLVEPFTSPNKLPGDIDQIFVHPDHPDKAIAFEAKRVKVLRTMEGADKINRLQEITKGIQQANSYRDLGFHQTYLLVLILDDGRHIETPNVMFRYNKDSRLESIYNIPWSVEINPEVGVIYLRINQMTGKHIDHSNSISYCIDKPAAPIIPTTEMINKIRSLSKRC